MRVWRLCRRRWAETALSGEGARLSGGRWNEKGQRVVYTSTSLSLAILELFVHVEPNEVPPDLVAVPIDVPDAVSRAAWAASDLPQEWRRYPAPASLRAMGSVWLRAKEAAALFVPSAVVPEEQNVLLNPLHDDVARMTAGPPRPFSFDPRMWK